VTAHGRKNEWICAMRLPELDNRFGDGRDVADTAAADADGYARSFRNAAGNARSGELAVNVARNVGYGAIWKALANVDESWKIHIYSILFRPGGNQAVRKLKAFER